MNKKLLISGCIALSCFIGSISVFASETTCSLIVNNRTIYSETEQPVIINGRILIPADKILPYGGIRSKYIEEKKQFIIDSKDNIKRLSLYIDNPVMEVYTYKTLLQADREDIQLDVAPQIIDGVPMFPLRAVAEAIGLEITWDETTESVVLNTVPNAVAPENRCVLSISADTEDVNAGDIVNITLKLSDVAQFKDYDLSALTGSIIYDYEEFEFLKTEYIPSLDGSVLLEASNGKYNEYGSKSVAVINNCLLTGENFDTMVVSFEALTDNGGTFVLSDYYNTLRGADNDIVVSDSEGKTFSISGDTDLIIDKTPVIIK